VKFAFLCGFVGFLLLGLGLGSNPFGFASLLLALGSGLMALILWMSGLKPRDPYSLAELQKVDEAERRRRIEDELDAIDSAGNAICLNCGNHFDPLLQNCPRCGKSLIS
jgi:hypothetical protein